MVLDEFYTLEGYEDDGIKRVYKFTAENDEEAIIKADIFYKGLSSKFSGILVYDKSDAIVDFYDQ